MRYRDKLLDERLRDIESGKTGDRVDLQSFIDARTDDGQQLDMDYIRAEILLVLLAGADTTGTTFQAMFFYIVSTPGVFDSLYYVACIRESMRLCPSAPNILPPPCLGAGNGSLRQVGAGGDGDYL
jgi:cytochrome P450